MQFKKTLVRLFIFLLPLKIGAQSTNLPQGSKHLQFLDRLEIMMQTNPDLNFSGIKPFSRKSAVMAAELADSLESRFPFDYYYHFSKVDKYNFQSLQINNQEWSKADKSIFQSRKPFLKALYKSKGDAFLVNEKDFFLSINPVIQQTQTLEANNSQRVFLNSKGITARGLIANRLGFDFYVTDNQERMPLFAQQLANKNLAVPGAGFYKPFKTTAFDYFDGRGSLYFNLAKYFNIQFGYDRNFIGSGYRSLLMSNFATNYLFLKIDTRIWKLNYTNIFMELIPSNNFNVGNILLPKKYAATHRLGINVAPWLNVGLYESIVFGRVNRFEFSYLNPVIFLRSAEQQNGSPDNAFVGFDFKANIGHKGQIYGQLFLDEFKLNEIRSRNGWWANKFGAQLGGKIIDIFDIKNLDLQGEWNFVRPFTYTHYDLVANYTHYNQPLAHPLGTGFSEVTGILRYQPKPKWTYQLRVIAFSQGVDSAGQNLGNNIFLDSDTRPFDYGYRVPSGLKSVGLNASLMASYEWKENLFIDGSLLIRRLKVSGRSDLSVNTSLFTIGIRANMFRREYDY